MGWRSAAEHADPPSHSFTTRPLHDSPTERPSAVRRADRLFSIVLELRRRGVTTAKQLADHLGVSERTIYRDIADLVGSGVPVEGEAGVGYRLGRNFDLPPLMFSLSEVQAIVLGVRMVESFADEGLRAAARSALAKVETVLPEGERHRVAGTALYAHNFDENLELTAHMPEVRRAIDDRRRLRLAYADAVGSTTERIVRPLGLFFWGRTWTVAGWCELREAHRTFRVDRIVEAHSLPDVFEHRPPVTLEDYIDAVSGGA